MFLTATRLRPPWPGLLVLAFLATAAMDAQTAGTATIGINAGQPGVRISTNLFGIFFEEINYAGEGGLYAELVRNRSFGNSTNADFWTLVTQGTATGQMSVDTARPLNANNTRALRLTMSGGSGSVGAASGGFWGMAVQPGAVYDLSFYASAAAGFTGPLVVRLESADGSRLYAQAGFGGLTTGWQRLAAPLTANGTDANARLVVSLTQPGTVWLDVVSLFPRATFHSRTNGMRADLGNLLADVKPAFMRFPGGNFVEGSVLNDAVRWKTTIGDIAARPGHWNSAWGYLSTDGLGFHEYLQLCDDLGCEPLFVIHCGLSLGYNGATNNTVPLDQMGPWVQDALDAIEYANGDTNTFWGAQRAANGHPAPFNLQYIEIGNENGGSYYNDRYALFYDAIKSNYPAMNLIACVWGGVPSSRPFDLQDEHYYSDWTFFANNAAKYDSYSRSGPKVYVGEYAVTSGAGNGNLQGALGEAAFMTGIERNSDVVRMASYAPLFANVNGVQWRPDAIYYDSSRSCGTPSYQVQKLFAQNQGDVVLPVSLSAVLPLDTNQIPRGAVGLGAWNTQVEYTNVVVTSNGVTLYQSDFSTGAPGWRVYNGAWSASGGLYRQTANTTDCRSTTGSTNWSNYTLTLRARKTGGSEGFLILFNWRADTDWTWWNIGGWNNTQHAIETSINGSKQTVTTSPGSVQTNRWYDLRVELSGPRVRCYLDGQLIHDYTYLPSKQGGIGLGTWNTSASFTNVVVTRFGQTNYQSDFSSGAAGWTVFNGNWSTSGSVYQQTQLATDCRSSTGSTNWQDYTLSLRARKDSGSEGFLIMFHRRDDNNWAWWNIGGWGNTKHAIEVCSNGGKSTLGSSVAGSIATNQWYDIRVELAGSRIRCYLDNALIHDVSYPTAAAPLFASASYSEAWGQVILKTVNVSSVPMNTALNVAGLASLTPQAGYTLLTGPGPAAENSLAQPTNVAPVTGIASGIGTNFTFTFPSNSLTVLRLQTPPTLPAVISLSAGATQQDLSALASGIAVGLGSFITNSVAVGYTLDCPGGVITNGTLPFVPGDLTKTIALPPGLPGCDIVRVTLRNPQNAVLGGPARRYFVRALNGPADPPCLGLACFPDETLLFWSDATARLLRATGLSGAWTTVTNAVSPVPLNATEPQRFFRLQR